MEEISVMIIMKHNYGQLGFPTVVEIKTHDNINVLERMAEKINSPPTCNDGMKAVILQMPIDFEPYQFA
jgi:hypothetical protein